MSKIFLESSSTAQWFKLVTEAEANFQLSLNEEIESYLVFLLMRHTQKPGITSNIMATEYLQSLAIYGQLQQDKLRDVGDQCLIFSGLFPKIAEKRMVTIGYYVNIGVAAYHGLADTCKAQLSDFYHQLADEFVHLMDILQVIRSMNKSSEKLTSLETIELWANTKSQTALQALQKVQVETKSTICLDTSPFKH